MFAFILLASLIPANFASVSAETPTTEQVNDYVKEAAGLIKDKCHGDCENVVILGDDYVVPSFRRDIKLLNWYYFLPFLADSKKDSILTDIGYVQRKAKTFAEFDDLFIRDEYNRQYEGKDVVVMVPDSLTTEQRQEIDRFKQILVDKGYKPDFSEKKSSQIYCNDPQLWNNLNGKTLFVFGTEENNYAYNCFPFQAGLENRDAAFIDINPWDGRNYAVIVNTNDALVIKNFAKIIEDNGYKNLSSESAYFFKVGIQTASYIALGVSAAALIAGTGGTAAPWIIVIGWQITETAIDGADAVDICKINPQGAGWCTASVTFAVLPLANSGTKNAVKRLADDDVIKPLKPFKELIEKYFNILRKHFNKISFGTVQESTEEVSKLAKGSEVIVKESGKSADEAIGAFKNLFENTERGQRHAVNTIKRMGQTSLDFAEQGWVRIKGNRVYRGIAFGTTPDLSNLESIPKVKKVLEEGVTPLKYNSNNMNVEKFVLNDKEYEEFGSSFIAASYKKEVAKDFATTLGDAVEYERAYGMVIHINTRGGTDFIDAAGSLKNIKNSNALAIEIAEKDGEILKLDWIPPEDVVGVQIFDPDGNPIGNFIQNKRYIP